MDNSAYTTPTLDVATLGWEALYTAVGGSVTWTHALSLDAVLADRGTDAGTEGRLSSCQQHGGLALFLRQNRTQPENETCFIGRHGFI